MSEKKPIMSKKTFDRIDSVCFVLVFALTMTIFAAKFGVSFVPSGSMYPNLKIGTVFFPMSVNPDDITYDDIVTFFPFIERDEPITNNFTVLYYQRVQNQQMFVKRVVGLGGDIIEVKDGVVYRNSQPIDPKYESEPANEDFGPYTVPADHIFVMGDNRNYSADSRVYGAFHKNQFYGKLVLKYPSFKNVDINS